LTVKRQNKNELDKYPVIAC